MYCIYSITLFVLLFINCDYFNSELIATLEELLQELSQLFKDAYVIMIDGLNYLSKENNSNCVNWLPEKIPAVSLSQSHHIMFINLEVHY